MYYVSNLLAKFVHNFKVIEGRVPISLINLYIYIYRIYYYTIELAEAIIITLNAVVHIESDSPIPTHTHTHLHARTLQATARVLARQLNGLIRRTVVRVPCVCVYARAFRNSLSPQQWSTKVKQYKLYKSLKSN